MSSNDQEERTTMSSNDQETDPRGAWTRQLLDAALNGEWAVIVQELSPADDIYEVRGLLGDRSLGARGL